MPPKPARFGPWFRRHPHLAIVAADVLFALVTVVQFATDDASDAVGLLFVLPIALLAQAFGLRSGLASALVGVALLSTWVAVEGIELSVLGWAARLVPMLLLGVLIGHASDAERHAEALATDLAVASERQREAAEINDTLVQHLAVAKWKLEAGDVDGGIELLDDTITAGEGLVASLLGGLKVTSDDRRRSRPRPLQRLRGRREAVRSGTFTGRR
ncbi:MAG: hypothetical protein JJE52_09630 [Acidimicrobiia bacterium]|nr:hypothetical protein [Acidimicrobiia bacterium]